MTAPDAPKDRSKSTTSHVLLFLCIAGAVGVTAWLNGKLRQIPEWGEARGLVACTIFFVFVCLYQGLAYALGLPRINARSLEPWGEFLVYGAVIAVALMTALFFGGIAWITHWVHYG